MSTERLESLAETVVFAHEGESTSPARDAHAAAFERTAALASAALAQREPLPPTLQARLAAAALQFCAERAAHPLPKLRVQSAPARRWPPVLMFAAGLAAGLALWLSLRDGRAGDRPAIERRAALLAERAADVRWSWQPGPSPYRGAISGEVVWSSTRQEGYLTFRGLPPLDADHRFQLWIVDGHRDGAPVDGGLFEVDDAGDTTVVPVHAALPIAEPSAFVVTVEDKAGVVVSKQEHVVALAKP